ncbi:TauD/TfdA family dioxygenase [Marininema mesophilum]|nr:TauD/TfdA family dioxygenase [Marininema mesophilum]
MKKPSWKKKSFQLGSSPISAREIVGTSHFNGNENGKLPLIIQPTIPDVDLTGWYKNNEAWVEENLLHYGGLLFRGFNIGKQEDFNRFIQEVCPQVMTYKEGATPRTKLSEQVYTSTEFPASQRIELHNELSYVHNWPRKIWFCSIKNAQKGGETPIADVRNVYKRISEETRARFVEKGWMLVRNFGEKLGLPWQDVFQTDSLKEVEEYCENHGITLEFLGNNQLRTKQVRPTEEIHPLTKEPLWFNHMVFWHESSLDSQVREMLLAEFGRDRLPFNTYYGDGEQIEDEVIAEIRAAYQAETIAFPWEEGDVLMLDNMMVAHGRNSFEGERKVLVSMGEPIQR